ncbi:hypothetical protein VB264_23785 [Arcicella aquatica]|uniref:Uncharacterized protein n=1 Tax=Arcicella aquatica TaxID=217141 RepID=A0ABU5QWY5_9BACT|nr:hypothetical protein [Arcicella aquatica]MEA5260841.1 hypothetical protein [Arcicella aquatica]
MRKALIRLPMTDSIQHKAYRLQPKAYSLQSIFFKTFFGSIKLKQYDTKRI